MNMILQINNIPSIFLKLEDHLVQKMQDQIMEENEWKIGFIHFIENSR